MLGLIGGTGIYDPEMFEDTRVEAVPTPYGEVPEVFIGRVGDREVAFLPRHGRDHSVPPHRVNYRANIAALKRLGVERVISTNSVGAINREMRPGDVVIPDDFVDFTRGRPSSFFDHEVVHVDVTDAYCPEVRRPLLAAARKEMDRVFDGGTYVCTEGPRFETPAEIRILGTLGGDIVGMVGVPEVVLAREAEMCYGAICTVTNMAAGISEHRLTATEVVEMVRRNEATLRAVVAEVLEHLPLERGCRCRNALKGARM
ncbi:MAG: S-methyl-5'-thioadenosine phosphorylase [Euryarchaeota archaeon]|nr:S-methyl-5'-thioadenosine phosphorylase [Euryarchaeota archaeon]